MPLTKAILIPLTDAEMAERGRQLATACKDLEEAEAAKKETAAASKAAIDSCEASIGRIANAIRSGKEEREIEIEQIPDYAARVWITRRLDTNEEIEREPMSDADAQAHLFTDGEIGIADPGPVPAAEDPAPAAELTDEEKAALAEAASVEDPAPELTTEEAAAVDGDRPTGTAPAEPTPKKFPCRACGGLVEAATGLLAEIQVAFDECPHCHAPAADAFGTP